jgi:hypothetical protein
MCELFGLGKGRYYFAEVVGGQAAPKDVYVNTTVAGPNGYL